MDPRARTHTHTHTHTHTLIYTNCLELRMYRTSCIFLISRHRMSKRPRFNYVTLLFFTLLLTAYCYQTDSSKTTTILADSKYTCVPFFLPVQTADIFRMKPASVGTSSDRYRAQGNTLIASVFLRCNFIRYQCFQNRKYVTTITLKWTTLRKYSKHVYGLIPLEYWAHTFKPHSKHGYVSMSTLYLIRVCLTKISIISTASNIQS